MAAAEQGNFGYYPVSGGYQSDRQRLQRGAGAHGPLPPRRRGDGAGRFADVYRGRQSGGERDGHAPARAEKPGAGHLQQPAVLHEYGESAAGLWAGTGGLVLRGRAGMGVYPGDGREPGVAAAAAHPRGAAGEGIRRKEYTSVFYYPGGVPAGRVAGGPRL